MHNVAALFIDERGPYPRLLGAERCWDEKRDARTYTGPCPVVAHPPCQLWGPFAKINYLRWGGEHNRPGNDGGCFKAAKEAVERWGGVLEHPAFSRAWAAYELRKPDVGWKRSDYGWVCEVWQSAYGHRARKRTWLYYCGESEPFELDWTRKPGTHQCGQYDQRGKDRNKPTLSKREASETPIAFAQTLIRLAEISRA